MKTLANNYRNSQGEKISIEYRMIHGVTPCMVLVIWDDPRPEGTGKAAPMMLDAGTRAWLRMQLDRLDANEKVQP